MASENRNLSREMAHAYLTGPTTGPTLYAIRCTLYAVLNMQNKPNFPKSQMNVKSYNTTDYENKSNWTLGENKPNQTQFSKGQNECKLTYNKGLQKKR